MRDNTLNKIFYIISEDKNTSRKEFQRNGNLSRKKLFEYLPAMMLTSISVLLLVSVDGLIVGRYVSKDALSSVNIVNPIISFIGVASAILASGVATCLSRQMGTGDSEKIQRTKNAGLKLMIMTAVIMSLIQIPIFIGLIASYKNLDPEMRALTWQYSIGLMVATPMGIVSTVGVYQLQIIGKMKVIAWLSIMEGVVNLLLDLLFVKVFNMGVAGAGFGTAGANLLRSTITVIYLAKCTDVYKSGGIKATGKDMKDVIVDGLPEGAYSLMYAVQGYCLMQIILNFFGSDGGSIKGICLFCGSIANIFVSGIQGAMRPMAGLMSGAEDRKGVRILVQQCIGLDVALVGLTTAVFELFPGVFYHIHGIKDIPEFGLTCVRIFALSFIFKGINTIFRLFFANRKDTKFATILTIAGNALIPVLAFVMGIIFKPYMIWSAYVITEVIILAVSFGRYIYWFDEDVKEQDQSEKTLYMSLKPDEAVKASRLMRSYANEQGYPESLSYRAALCVEEMVAYAAESQKSPDLNIQLTIRFTNDSVVFVIIDNGKCIALDINKEQQKITTDNYDLIKRIAKSVEYQYILDMNFTKIVISKLDRDARKELTVS